MATLGSGDYRFEKVPEWPKLPKHWILGPASDAAVNSQNEVHIMGRGDHPLTIWDTDGNFISSWGEGTFSANPHGIHIAPDDNVWLVDRDFHIVTEYTPGGQVIRTLGTKLAPAPVFKGEPFNMPSAVFTAPDGNLFVSDGYGAHRVHKFSPDGRLVHSWGKEGTGPGEFALLHAVWVDSRGRVIISDRENSRLQFFDGNGEFLEEWTDVERPGGVWVHDELLYVVESGPAGVSIWTLDHELVTRWSGREGPGEGTVTGGHGICVDLDGSIYICEAGPKKVTKFQRV